MYFEELKVGMSVDIPPVTIEREKMLEFAYNYDYIPLHTDEEYAKKTHFGKLIAPGMMSFASVWAKYLEVDFFGEGILAGKAVKIEWLKPVFIDDVLSAKATITALTPRNAKNGIAEITVEAFNQNGEKVFESVGETVVKIKL